MAIATIETRIAIALPKDTVRRQIMGYIKAENILPKDVLELIQQYVDGQTLYIPRKSECHKPWGTKTGTKENLLTRNLQMYEAYCAGATITELSKRYYLTEKSVQRILRHYRNSSKIFPPNTVLPSQTCGGIQLNRENKRKSYEKGYYKNHACHDTFTCKVCGRPVVPEGAGTAHRNHCPNCLCSLHVDESPGDRKSNCGGYMDPVAVWVRNNGEWAVIHRCRTCGHLNSNRTAADDNPMKLMSIAMKPLTAPPFPLERIEEMTRLMGGEGSLN